MTRLEANAEIIKILLEIMDKNPDLRFGQLLSNLEVVLEDPFYEESEITLNRVKRNVGAKYYEVDS